MLHGDDVRRAKIECWIAAHNVQRLPPEARAIDPASGQLIGSTKPTIGAIAKRSSPRNRIDLDPKIARAALAEHGSRRAAAAALGVSTTVLRRVVPSV